MSSQRRSNLVRVCAGMAAIALSALLSLALVSCGEDSSPTGNTPINRAPAAPTIDTGSGAPADTATDVSVAAALHWTCSDPDGDALTYDVHLGTAAAPPVVSADQAGSSFDPTSLDTSTEYFWQVVATDPDGETATSPIWSFTTAALAVETVSKPSAPTGPDGGLTEESLTFVATGAVSSFGIPVQYRFDWGDGTMSNWSANTATNVDADYAWATAGGYDVKVQARSSRTPAIESDWSDAKSILIEVPAETITMTTNVSGPDNLAAGVIEDFTISGFVTSSEGHATEWRFVWGDGEFSDWITVKEGSHAYATEGTYDIGLEGRCAEHTSASHERVRLHTVEVAASETITIDFRVDGISSRNYSQSEYALRAWATSSYGHPLELRIDFGDGKISDWFPEFSAVSHSWDLGTYTVKAQARCADHPEILSEWGGDVVAEFREFLVGIGNKVSGPVTGNVGVPVEFTVGEVTSNEGHAVEYMYFYRRANTSDYIWGEYGASPTQTVTWAQPGTYYVYARARCVLHPDVTNQTSDLLSIVISP